MPNDDLGSQISAKKMWMLCRARITDSKKITTGTDRDDDVLPAPTRANLVEVWFMNHKYNLSGGRLLSEQLIKQLYDNIHSKLRKLGIHLLESLRLQSAITSTPKMALPMEFRPG